jgi:FixJ family two-component response regulator
VVMLTSEGRRETIEDSLKAGAADFIVKPFTKEALIKKLDRFLLASGHGPSAGVRPRLRTSGESHSVHR